MISWNCLSSIYPSIICTNYTELLRCTQRFVVSRSWGNGVTRCPVQNLKLYRHYEINADQMKSRRTKMQSRRTKMQSWRTKMQFRRTKIQSEQTKMQSERTKIKSERTKMQPSTMSLKKEGRPLFLFYLILFKIHNLQRDSFPGTGIGFRPSLASGPVPVLIVFYSPLSVVSSFTCPQLCPLNCKNASAAVLPSVSGRIEYSLWCLCNLYDWQAIVSKCNDLMVSLKQTVTYDIYIHIMPINWYSFRRWSLGVILYIRPSGTPPFSEDRWLFVSSRLICPSNIDLTVCMAGPVGWIWELKYSR